MQGSAEDWDHEVARMGSVYRYSTCNITALDAANSTEGCLSPQNSRTLEPELIHVCTISSHEERYLVNETDLYDDHVLYTKVGSSRGSTGTSNS